MNQPWNVIKASDIPGVVLDCDLTTGTKIGGGTATDNTTALNDLLATASRTNPIKLILDGPTLISAPLTIAAAGYTCIEGIGKGSGLYVKSGSTCDAINNGAYPFQPSGSAPAQAGPVVLRDFYINGNRGDGETGNSNTGNPRGVVAPSPNPYWLCNIVLYNVQGIEISGMFIYDAPTYSIRLMNCSNVRIVRNYILNPNATAGFNNDGIHIDAPCTDLYIAENYINNNNSDDGIALNAPEGYAGGTIDRVYILNNTLASVLHALRIYGASDGQVGSVVFSDNIGTVQEAVIYTGVGTPGTGDYACRDLICSNCVFSLTGGNCGWWMPTSDIGSVTFNGCTWLNPGVFQYFIRANTSAITLASVSFNHCRVYRTPGGSSLQSIMHAYASCTISRLNINGFTVENSVGQTYGAITNFIDSSSFTIASCFVGALDYTNITAFADSYTGIAALSGNYQSDANIQKVTGAYTTLPTDSGVLIDTTSAAFAVALPTKTYKGWKCTYKNVSGGANAATITGTIDGTANPTLASMAKITVVYDGSAYWTV